MAEMDDLFTALNMFKTGVNEFQISRSINSANEAVAQIRSSAESEAKKREQLQQLSNQLTTQLAAQGTPATTIQQVGNAIAPQHFATGEQAILEGVLADKPELVEQGKKAASIAKEDDMAAKRADREFMAKEKVLDRQLQRELAGLKVGKLTKLPTQEAEKLINSETSVQEWSQLREDLVAHPEWSGNKFHIPGAETAYSKMSPEFATWKSSLMNRYFAIRKEITGVAGSQREYAEIKANQPMLTDPQNVLISKMQRVEDNYNRASKIRLKTLAKLGYDVRQMAGVDNSSKGESASVVNTTNTEQKDALSLLPAGSKILGTTLKNGKRMTVYQLPDGRKVAR